MRCESNRFGDFTGALDEPIHHRRECSILEGHNPDRRAVDRLIDWRHLARISLTECANDGCCQTRLCNHCRQLISLRRGIVSIDITTLGTGSPRRLNASATSAPPHASDGGMMKGSSTRSTRSNFRRRAHLLFWLTTRKSGSFMRNSISDRCRCPLCADPVPIGPAPDRPCDRAVRDSAERQSAPMDRLT